MKFRIWYEKHGDWFELARGYFGAFLLAGYGAYCWDKWGIAFL